MTHDDVLKLHKQYIYEGETDKDAFEWKEIKNGYESIFKQEKGYEAYEYFDTSRDLGTLLEIKEIY